jgi:hypothetical protein
LQHVAEAAGILLATVTLIISIIAVLFARRYKSYIARYVARRPVPSVRLSEMLPQLKTGDLVLTIASLHWFVNSVLWQSTYGHAGVIVVKDGVPYIAQEYSTRGVDALAGAHRGRIPAAELYLPMPEGSGMVTLEYFLRTYLGTVCISALERPLPPDREAALRRKAAEHWPFMGGWRDMLRRLITGRPGHTRHCFEWVADLLTAARLRAAGRPWLTDLWSANQGEAIVDLAERGTLLSCGNRYLPPLRLENDLCHLPIEAWVDEAPAVAT